MTARSPTLLFDHRAYGSENLSPMPRLLQQNLPTTEVVNIHLASDTADSSDYLRDRAEDLACDYFKSRKRA